MRIEWEGLPKEEKALFNPAFLAIVLARVSEGHHQRFGEPVPLPIAILSSTLVLHRPTRERLPNTIATNMLAWIERNADLTATVGIHAPALVPHLKEGLLFSLTDGLCRLTESGGIVPGRNKPPTQITGQTADVIACQRKAFFVGRWLAGAGTPATILALFGLRP